MIKLDSTQIVTVIFSLLQFERKTQHVLLKVCFV